MRIKISQRTVLRHLVFLFFFLFQRRREVDQPPRRMDVFRRIDETKITVVSPFPRRSPSRLVSPRYFKRRHLLEPPLVQTQRLPCRLVASVVEQPRRSSWPRFPDQNIEQNVPIPFLLFPLLFEPPYTISRTTCFTSRAGRGGGGGGGRFERRGIVEINFSRKAIKGILSNVFDAGQRIDLVRTL